MWKPRDQYLQFNWSSDPYMTTVTVCLIYSIQIHLFFYRFVALQMMLPVGRVHVGVQVAVRMMETLIVEA